jgi:hypothetical protein
MSFLPCSPSARPHDWHNTCRFPAVNTNGQVQVFTITASYDAPTDIGSDVFNSITFDTSRGMSWKIQKSLCSQTDTFSSILSSFNYAVPAEIYLYSSYAGNKMSGSSLGLATALCLVGCNDICATGFLVSFGGGDPAVHDIDNLLAKIKGCRTARVPLMFPLGCVTSDSAHSQLREWNTAGRFYTLAHYVRGVPYDINNFYGIAVASFSEAIILAQSTTS